MRVAESPLTSLLITVSSRPAALFRPCLDMLVGLEHQSTRCAEELKRARAAVLVVYSPCLCMLEVERRGIDMVTGSGSDKWVVVGIGVDIEVDIEVEIEFEVESGWLDALPLLCGPFCFCGHSRRLHRQLR